MTHAGGVGVVESVFVEVAVPFESPNAGHVRREVGWPLASLRSVSCDWIIAQDIKPGGAEEAKPMSVLDVGKLLTRLSSMLVFLWCLVM